VAVNHQAFATTQIFDPATSNRVFHVGLPDHAVAKYAPLIYDTFNHVAPTLSVHLHDVRTNYLPAMPGVIKTHETAVPITSHQRKARLWNAWRKINRAENRCGEATLRSGKNHSRMGDA